MSEQALLHAYPGLAGSDLSEAVLHQLKHWCIQGLDCATRQDHTSTRLTLVTSMQAGCQRWQRWTLPLGRLAWSERD